MTSPSEKRVDESWKERVELEKQQPGTSASPPSHPASGGQPLHEEPPRASAGTPEVRFDVFLSGLAMEALIALGDAPHPQTRKTASHLPQARYLIDLLGVLEEKTRGNLSVDEERLLKETLYQLRMRYMAKSS